MTTAGDGVRPAAETETTMDAAPTGGNRTDDAASRMRRAFAALPALLARHEPTDPEVMDLRADLAIACAESGELESALQQVGELVKDAERSVGPEHELTARMRAARETVLRVAGITEA